MGLPDLSGSNIQDTYQRVLHTSGGAIFDGTGSTVPISFSGDNVTVAGTITAQTYVVSESVINVTSGSTIFGNSSDDTHTFTGDITASGQISSSGTGENYLSGDLNMVDADIVFSNDKGLRFENAAGTEFGNILMNSSDNMVYQNLRSNRDVIFRAGNSTNEGSIIVQKGGTSDALLTVGTHKGLDISGSFTASGDISASGNIYGDITADTDNSVVIYKNGRLYTDEIDSRVWGSTLLDSTDTAACADQIKTIQCAATDAPRYLTFVDDNNTSADCETLRTNENIFWNCRTRVLTVNGAIKSKGSDITLMSGSISASGAITASNVSMSGDMTATTGSFNHIVTDGDTIEFRQAGTTTKLGHIKFSDKGAEFGDSAGTGKSNLTASIVRATNKFISEGSAELTGDVTMSGHFSASGEIDTSKMRTGKMLSISPHDTNLQFGNDTNGTRIHGDFIQLGDPASTTQVVTSSGNIIAPQFAVSGSTGNYFTDGQITIKGKDSTGGDVVLRGGLTGITTEAIDGHIDSDNGFSILLNAGQTGNYGSFNIYNANNNSAVPGVNTTHIFSMTKTGNITSSGHISSSNNVYATQFIGSEVQVTDAIAIDSNAIVYAEPNLRVKNSGLEVALGDITASSHISASGDIFGDDITAATKFVGTELESSTNLTLDATADIILSADGDQIKMNDGTTTRFTFNVDATPEIDVAGDLIIDPTGGDVQVDGVVQSYANSSYPNYAVGGSQGYHTYYMIPAHKFEGENSKYQAYSFSSNAVSFSFSMNAGTSFIIPKGYKLASCMIPMAKAGAAVKIYTTQNAGWCAPALVKSMTATKCPTISTTVEQAYVAAATVFSSTEAAKLTGNDLTMCIIEISVANKDALFGAFFTMEQIS